jgi:hypothetical protein
MNFAAEVIRTMYLLSGGEVSRYLAVPLTASLIILLTINTLNPVRALPFIVTQLRRIHFGFC